MRKWFALSFVAAMVLLNVRGSGAQAQSTVTQSNVSGTHYVGMVSGSAAIVSQSSNGTCFSPVFVSNSAGGLHGNAQINGTSLGANTIFLVASTVSFCGQTISPIIRNGFAVTLVGGTAADWVFDLGIGGTTLNGGFGNDVLATFANSTTLNGHNDSDFLYGNSGTVSNGNDGDDTHCPAPGTPLLAAFGGNGSDSLCGTAFFTSSIENTACTCSLF